MSRHPEVQWAEREDKVYLTVMLADAKNVKVGIDPEGVFTFSGSAGADNNRYELKLELRGKVDVEESKVNIGAKKVFCILMKADKNLWNKLLRGSGKSPHYVKVDWDKWIDEDDDRVPADVDTSGMDFSKFGAIASGFGNLSSGSGGMDGGTEEEDVDEVKEEEKEKHNMGDYPEEDTSDPDMSDLTDHGQQAPLLPLPEVAQFSSTAAPDSETTGKSKVEISAYPELQWAEREDKVYLTLIWANAKDLHVCLNPEGVFTLSGIVGADNNRCKLELVLLDKVNVEESKVNVSAEKILFILMKVDKKWWKKLVRGQSPHYVKVDCDKWVEEDGDEALADVDTSGMDFSKFGEMGSGSGNQGVTCVIGEQPDMSHLGLDFAGFGEKDGKVFARYTYRKTQEMMRRMGLEKAKEFKTVTLDPNNPEDRKKKVYI